MDCVIKAEANIGSTGVDEDVAALLHHPGGGGAGRIGRGHELRVVLDRHAQRR